MYLHKGEQPRTRDRHGAVTWNGQAGSGEAGGGSRACRREVVEVVLRSSNQPQASLRWSTQQHIPMLVGLDPQPITAPQALDLRKRNRGHEIQIQIQHHSATQSFCKH